MDLQKAKIFLEKINREFASMQREPDAVSAIDVDILRQYVRDFYDAILSEKSSVVFNTPAPPAVKEQPPAPKPPARPIGFNPERNQPKPEPPQEIIVSERPRQAAAPKIEEISRPAPAPVFEPEPPVAPPAPKKEEKPQEFAPPPPFHASPETIALFEFKAPKEISEKLSETPIADLKKAFALNDRLLFTRELFGGDAKALENAVATLQSLGSFEEAKSFLIQFCAEQFHWAEKHRVEHARHFIKIVRRRFAG